MLELWETWAQGKVTDLVLNVLAQSRTFLAWVDKKGWSKHTDLLDTMEVNGKMKKGKPKPTQDEAHQLVSWCLAHPDDPGAVPTVMAFLLGMRASEIVTRGVRHLDGKGTLIDVTDAKTEAGERTLKPPSKLQPLLAKLAEGKSPDQMLFGERTRHWVLRSVKRCCEAAGVRVVSPHGLRGTHAKMAREVASAPSYSPRRWATSQRRRRPSTTRAALLSKTQPLTASQAWCIKSGAPRIEQKRSISKQLKFTVVLSDVRPHFVPGPN